MSKQPQITEDQLQDALAALPQSDQRFIGTSIILCETIGDDRLRYRELPDRLRRTLRRLDRNTSFSVIVECLGFLLDPPALKRVKQAHRRRNGTK